MTYNVFGGTLNLTQSVNQSFQCAASQVSHWVVQLLWSFC